VNGCAIGGVLFPLFIGLFSITIKISEIAAGYNIILLCVESHFHRLARYSLDT
jgi:hypothetical protein